MKKSRVLTFTQLIGRFDNCLSLKKQLYEKIKFLIENENLKKGDVLPSSRDCAQILGLSRVTITTVFKQLIEEGYLKSKIGSGTFVCYEAQIVRNRKTSSFGKFSFHKTRKALIAESIHSENLHQAVPFAICSPDIDSLPGSRWTKIVARLSKSPWMHNGYAHPNGYLPCRQAISNYVRRMRGITCEPEQIIMTSGIQEGLSLCSLVLFEPGDWVAVEEPTHQPNLARLEFYGLNPYLVDARNGLNINELINSREKIKGILLTPNHQYPLCHVMSLEEKEKLIRGVIDKNIWIIENDYDGDIFYGPEPVPAMASIYDGNIIYLGTFSKTIYPGLCLGYLIAPKEIAKAFSGAKYLLDRHVSEVHQTILTEFMEQGHYEAHIRRLKKLYSVRRSALIEAIKENLSDFGYAQDDDKGIHVVFYLDSKFDDDAEVVEFIKREFGIELESLSHCFRQKPVSQGLILGFCHFPVDEIKSYVKKLKKGLETYLKITQIRRVKSSGIPDAID